MSELQEKIGALLASERKRQNRTLENLSVELKISESNLEYIERGDASTLPAPLYFELFARSYAQALGIDYDATSRAIGDDVEELGEAPADRPAGTGDGDEEPDLQDGEEAAPTAGNPLKKVAYIVGGATLLLVVFLIVNWYFLPKSAQILPELSPLGNASDNTDQQAEETAAVNLVANYDWNTPAYVPPDSITIVLSAREESWVLVETDGDLRISRVFSAGEVRIYKAANQLKVSVGIPPRVEVQLDGQIVDLRSESGRISGVEITQLNRAEILDGTPPYQTSTSRITRPPEPEEAAEEVTPQVVTPQVVTPQVVAPEESASDGAGTSEEGD